MQGSIGCDFKIPEYFKLTIFQHTSGCAFSGTQLIQWLLHPAMQGHVLIGFVKKCEKLLVHFSYWMEWKRWYFKRQKCFWSSSITLFCLTFPESADTVQFRKADSLKKCLVSFFPAVQFVPRMAGHEATVVPCRPPKLHQRCLDDIPTPPQFSYLSGNARGWWHHDSKFLEPGLFYEPLWSLSFYF